MGSRELSRLSSGGAGGRRISGNVPWNLEDQGSGKRRKVESAAADGASGIATLAAAAATASPATATIVENAISSAQKSKSQEPIMSRLRMLNLEQFNESIARNITCTRCAATSKVGDILPRVKFVVYGDYGLASRVALMCEKCGNACGTHEPEVVPTQIKTDVRKVKRYSINVNMVGSIQKLGLTLGAIAQLRRWMGWVGGKNCWARAFGEEEFEAKSDRASNLRFLNALTNPVRSFLESMDIRDAEALMNTPSSDISKKYIEWRESEGMPAMKGEGAIVTVSTWKGIIRKTQKKNAPAVASPS